MKRERRHAPGTPAGGRAVARPASWPRSSLALAAAGVLGCAGGALLIAGGVLGGEPDAAPLPAHTFSVAAPARSGQGSEADEPVSMAPSRVAIPSLDITAPIEDRHVRSGELVIPGDPSRLARWADGAELSGTTGTLLLAGHVDIDGDLGALHDLSRIAAGARIHTSDTDGRVTTWTVTALQVRDKSDLPRYSATDARQLVIVTCGGPVDRVGGRWTYRDNVIVTATPLHVPVPADTPTDTTPSATPQPSAQP